MTIINTIGVEIEGVANTVHKVEGLLSGLGKYISAITRDASVESRAYPIGNASTMYMGHRLLAETSRMRGGDMILGSEIVTKPLIIEDMRRAIPMIMGKLNSGGEVFSNRSSFHVHVGYPKDLLFLKSCLSLGRYVEPLLFKIAGMGRPYRGQINQSAFARPLDLPPAVKVLRRTDDSEQEDDEDFYCVSLRTEDLGKATTAQEFWSCFGLDPRDNRPRYHPARYFGLNLYSISLRGTIEFRFFNYCEESSSMLSVISLCQNLAELMAKIPSKMSDNLVKPDIFKANPDVDYHNVLETIRRLSKDLWCDYSISDHVANDIHGLIETTQQPVFKRGSYLTHLEKFFLRRDFADACKLQKVLSTEDSGVVSIHNFSEDDRSII